MKKDGIFLAALALWVCVFLSGAGCEPTPGDERGLSDVTDRPDPYMGDWQGEMTMASGEKSRIAAQVIALPGGQYQANILPDFDSRKPAIAMLSGGVKDGAVLLSGAESAGGLLWDGVIKGDAFTARSVDGAKRFELEPVVRISPTLGLRPPRDAVVLFDGTSLDAWKRVGSNPGYVDLSRYVGGFNTVAYMDTYFESDRDVSAQLEVGSDDAVKVWLNGTVVHANNVMRGHKFGEDKIPVQIQQGRNHLRMKVVNGFGGWGASARLADMDKKALKGVTETRPVVNMPKENRDVSRFGGYLTLWDIRGPFGNAKAGVKELLDYQFKPETGRVDSYIDTVKMVDILKDSTDEPDWFVMDGSMQVAGGSIVTRQGFRDFKMHAEFNLPFMPEALGQARANSGVYMQGRYEVQVLDSYGLEGRDNECGGIYTVSAPRVNMCAPPGQWQTYDIEFYAPRFDAEGTKISDARITVYHNGVPIQDNVEIPKPTGGQIDMNVSQPGGIMLQDHGNPVRFRNIWLVEL